MAGFAALESCRTILHDPSYTRFAILLCQAVLPAPVAPHGGRGFTTVVFGAAAERSGRLPKDETTGLLDHASNRLFLYRWFGRSEVLVVYDARSLRRIAKARLDPDLSASSRLFGLGGKVCLLVWGPEAGTRRIEWDGSDGFRTVELVPDRREYDFVLDPVRAGRRRRSLIAASPVLGIVFGYSSSGITGSPAPNESQLGRLAPLTGDLSVSPVSFSEAGDRLAVAGGDCRVAIRGKDGRWRGRSFETELERRWRKDGPLFLEGVGVQTGDRSATMGLSTGYPVKTFHTARFGFSPQGFSLAWIREGLYFPNLRLLDRKERAPSASRP